MRVLVTGATGFIGYHAARQLLEEGHEVRALVRSLSKADRVFESIGLSREHCIEGDMTDAAAVARAIEGCDAVLHAAAGVSVTGGQSDFQDNLIGTQNVIGAAVERDLHSIFVSSVTALFRAGHKTTDESPLVESKTRYGRSKGECDRWVREQQAAGGQVCIVYPPGVVGPDDPGMSESVRAYRSFLRGTLKSEGGNQMLDVRDLAKLNVRLLESKTTGRVAAAGHFFDWDELTLALEEVTGAKISRIAAPGWVLRGGARLLDVVGKVSGRKMPFGGEGIEIATRFQPVIDSAVIETLDVHWRPAEDTLHDLFQWFLDTGRLPASAVPALEKTSA